MLLVESRSAHLDERTITDLALTYRVWAPGQHAAAIEAIAIQEQNISLADTLQTDEAALAALGRLDQVR